MLVKVIMSDKTDEELIKDFQNGNINSYNHLVFRYKDRLFNYIYQFVHDIDLAEDLLQDTFLKLYTHKNSYKEIAKFSTWIYTIAGNFAKTELRKFKRRKTYSHSDLSFNDNEFIIEDKNKTPSDVFLDEGLRKSLHQCLSSLPLNFKNIIILRDIQELSYDEISTIVELSLGTVKSRINRARLKLYECLQNKGLE
jgi:RNA polymerase sigma-70 factor (ECF subfamily)